MNDTSNTWFSGDALGNVLPSYQWTHIAITYDNPNICVYINGELKHTNSGVSNSNSFHYATKVVHDSPYHKINDFRLYDECLSPKQIKYISQAMICHYPMGNVDGKIGGRNLCLNASQYRENNPITSVKGTDGYIYLGDRIKILKLEKDVIYTVQCNTDGVWSKHGDDSVNKGVTLWLHNRTGSSAHYCFEGNEKETGVKSWQFKAPETSDTYEFRVNSYSTQEVRKFWDFKIEKGTIATAWTPAPEDNSQFYDNIIPDISGYRNNATVKDSTCPAWSDDSPRYLGSYRFDATKEMFLNPIVFSGFADSYTFSWWGKNSQSDSSMYWGFIDGNRLNLYSTDGYLFWNIGDSQDNPFNDPVTTNKVSSYTDGKWHHYCITGDGASNKLYVDGKIYGIAKTYRKITGTKIHINGWDDGVDYKINGNISDFRIYATALSESDVLNLYQSSASLDSQGTLMLAGEVIE